MKIRIRENNRGFTLLLPTRLLFSKLSVKIVNRAGRKYAPEAMAMVSPDALEALWGEMRRIKKKYGTWTLVEVDSADGEHINITL